MSGVIPRLIEPIALFAALVASALGIAVPLNAAYADDCLAAPNSAAPPGSHWYYRIDRAKKLKCWYIHALGESGQQAAARTMPAAAHSVRLPPIETQFASMPPPPADASIPPSSADSPALLKMPDAKPQQAPLISATTDADVKPSGQEGSHASSIPQALGSQKATSQADELNPASMSTTRDATMDADVERSGREGGSPASSNPQALALQIAAPTADGPNPLPLIATPEVAKPAEEIGALISFGHRWNIGGTPALMPTEEMIAVFVFGMAVAGILFGILWAIIRARGQGIIDHLESSFIDDPEQLEGREPDLEAALRANLMALAQPLESKRFMKAFLP